MIITLADAIDTIALGEHEEDALNEVSRLVSCPAWNAVAQAE